MTFDRAANVKPNKSASNPSKPEGLYDAVVTRVALRGERRIKLGAIIGAANASSYYSMGAVIGSEKENNKLSVYAQIPRLAAGFEFGPLSYVGSPPFPGDRAFVGFKEGRQDELVLLTGALSLGEPNVQSFSRSSDLEVYEGTHKLAFPVAVTIIGVQGTLGAAASGSDVILDIHKGSAVIDPAVTIFADQSKRPRILDGETVGTMAAPDISSVLVGEYLTVHIDQIGATLPGSDLSVHVWWRPA